jgi:cation diffusion facilitator CzcD-associated flavoprotein CzcO
VAGETAHRDDQHKRPDIEGPRELMRNNVFIIGAGSSGIVAAKTLHERGIPFDCFEKGSNIGGLWRYEIDNGVSVAYRSLHINTSRSKMQFADFPMPSSYPDFPHHSQIAAYFDGYVHHFGIRDRITFQTAAQRVEPVGAGESEFEVHIESRSGECRAERYDAVIIANRYHWRPRLAVYPGEFTGETLHASRYRTPDDMAGKPST